MIENPNHEVVVLKTGTTFWEILASRWSSQSGLGFGVCWLRVEVTDSAKTNPIYLGHFKVGSYRCRSLREGLYTL